MDIGAAMLYGLLVRLVAGCLGVFVVSRIVGTICLAAGTNRTVCGVFLWGIPLAAMGVLPGFGMGIWIYDRLAHASPSGLAAAWNVLLPACLLLGAATGMTHGLLIWRWLGRRTLG